MGRRSPSVRSRPRNRRSRSGRRACRLERRKTDEVRTRHRNYDRRGVSHNSYASRNRTRRRQPSLTLRAASGKEYYSRNLPDSRRARNEYRSSSRRQIKRRSTPTNHRRKGEARNALFSPPASSDRRDRNPYREFNGDVRQRSLGRRKNRDDDTGDDEEIDDESENADTGEVSLCTEGPPTDDNDEDEEEDDASDDSVSYYSEYEEDASDAVGVAPKAKPEKKEDILHFEWTEGMLLKGRYKISKQLGDGTFGRVVHAKDDKTGRQVAIKVIREVEKYVRNAKREAEILTDIREAGKKGTARCVLMHDTFTHDKRLFCLVFEVLGPSLYDVLKKNRFRGLWVQDIQTIARQCLDALSFLHEGIKMTHTDLKLENVLLQSTEALIPSVYPREADYLERHASQRGKPHTYMRPASSSIKLIDFGNATYELEHHSSIINTRQYRAPEVILAMGWDEHSDLWSTGCILMELYTGELLFRTHDSLEHLALMERIIEPFPQSMFAGASTARKESCLSVAPEGLRLLWPPPAPDASAAASDAPGPQRRPEHVAAQEKLCNLVLPSHELLASFVGSLLRPDPATRPSASVALQHEFLAEIYTD